MVSASPDDENVSLGPGLRHSPSSSPLDLDNRSFAKRFVFSGGGFCNEKSFWKLQSISQKFA